MAATLSLFRAGSNQRYNPLAGPFDHIGRVAVERDTAGMAKGAQALDRGAKLHLLVGGPALAS
jgi:hypothetical protein